MKKLLLLFIFTSLQAQPSYDKLQDLFVEWRIFENPPLLNGAPDYTKKQFKKRKGPFKKLQKKLNNIDTTNWSKSKQVDWQIIEAEMNGYDFNQRILKSWERDPAFYQTIWMYQSDVPAHEGPVNHALLEYWQYSFPLNVSSKEKLYSELDLIPAFLKQAEKNLTGNARDLWIAGINNIRDQGDDLETIKTEIILSDLDHSIQILKDVCMDFCCNNKCFFHFYKIITLNF